MKSNYSTLPDTDDHYCHFSAMRCCLRAWVGFGRLLLPPVTCCLLYAYRLAPQYEFAIPVETMADCLRGLLNTVYDGDIDGLNASSRCVGG